MLDREEYVEQAYFFKAIRERMEDGYSTQELIQSIRQEILSTTSLPFALDFMSDELKHSGGFSKAMARLSHYFTTFQTHVISEAEKLEGRFDFRIGCEILEKEASYRAKDPAVQGVFLYQFETICRNRLGYDAGIKAIAGDPIYDDRWRDWLDLLRRQIGIIDFCDMIYTRSVLYYKHRDEEPEHVPLFGEKEGKIAYANRRKDPIYLFSALQRHLEYPAVPRQKLEDANRYIIPVLQQQVAKLETRLRLLEEELRGGLNIARFYAREDKNESGGNA